MSIYTYMYIHILYVCFIYTYTHGYIQYIHTYTHTYIYTRTLATSPGSQLPKDIKVVPRVRNLCGNHRYLMGEDKRDSSRKLHK